jgi:hypothetical protein
LKTYFLVPQTVSGDPYGYEFLADIAGSTLSSLNLKITIDFHQCVFFEGNLCAVLGSVIKSLLKRNNEIVIDNLASNLRGALSRNGFLNSIPGFETALVGSSSAVLFAAFGAEDEVAAKNYFEGQLFDKANMPFMSRLAKKKIIEALFEVCVNALTHAGCIQVYSCGQLFYRQNPPRAVITLVDLGITIKANVNNHFERVRYSGNASIIWALEEGNTTKTGSTPGGLGLKILQDLVMLNRGKLQVVSADGFIEYKDGTIIEKKINIDFPGTIVTIELLLNDSNLYILKVEEAESEEIIF